MIELWPALDAVLPPVERQGEGENASAVAPPAARRETSEIDPAAFQSAPNDAASTIDEGYRGITAHPRQQRTKRIRKAIMAVYACAEKQNTAIPNNREMYKPVSELLAREGKNARSTRVEEIARKVRNEEDVPGGKYQRLICGAGDRFAKRGSNRRAIWRSNTKKSQQILQMPEMGLPVISANIADISKTLQFCPRSLWIILDPKERGEVRRKLSVKAKLKSSTAAHCEPVANTGDRPEMQRPDLPASLNRDRVLDSEQASNFLGISLVHFRRLYRASASAANYDRPQEIRLAGRRADRLRRGEDREGRLTKTPRDQRPARGSKRKSGISTRGLNVLGPVQ